MKKTNVRLSYEHTLHNKLSTNMVKKYIKINLASPKKVLKWTERSLPNGDFVGQIIKPMRIK